MRKIAHMSDLHFGRTDSTMVAKLAERVNELEPDLVVVSGDLTQRARRSQFAQAASFLGKLPQPQIVVPGNHDIPLYDVFSRFLRPLSNYRKFITSDLQPCFFDEEIAVMGLNTARSAVFKGGRISDRQVRHLHAKLDGLDERLTKIVVTHHPFDLPSGSDESDIVDRAEEAMPIIAESGADVFLSGHLHVSGITNSAHRYRLKGGYAALVIQAGTAVSSRSRGEANSFNLIEVDAPFLSVKRYECRAASSGFVLSTDEGFTQTAYGWSRM